DLARHGDFQYTIGSALGVGHGWIALVPFVAAVVVAIWLGARSAVDLGPGGARLALAALGVWAVLATVLPALIESEGGKGAGAGALVIVAAGAAAGLATLVLRTWRARWE